MILRRLLPPRTSIEIEVTYRAFLRKTWIAVPIVLTLAIFLLSKTHVFLSDDQILDRNEWLQNLLGVFALVLLPLLAIVLVFTRGRRQLPTILMGRFSNLWQVVVVGVVLGVVGHLSSDSVIHLYGATPVAPADLSKVDGKLDFAFDALLVAPIFEESAFRLVLQTYLQRFGAYVAIGATAVLFTFIHLPVLDRLPERADIIQISAVLIPAILFSLSRSYFGSMLSVLVTHVTDNALSALGSAPTSAIPGCC